jgi:hypothetical protein
MAISAQIYGLRWARLLLGREISMENCQIFRIWDYLFACCYEAENFSPEHLMDIDVRPNVNSILATVRISGCKRDSNEDRRRVSSFGSVKHSSPNESSMAAVPQYVCTPLLGALGDVMLAMMVQVLLVLFSCVAQNLVLYVRVCSCCLGPRCANGRRLQRSAGVSDALSCTRLSHNNIGLCQYDQMVSYLLIINRLPTIRFTSFFIFIFCGVVIRDCQWGDNGPTAPAGSA